MVSASSYLFTAFWILAGTTALLWTIPCGAVASWGEKQGINFQKLFLVSIFLTPLAGVILVWIARPTRADATLTRTAGRS